MKHHPVVVGILVGGRASRMGGVVKGLLPSPDGGEPIVARLVRITRTALPGADLVLLGEAKGFEALGLPALPDEAPPRGPLSGLARLLAEADARRATAILLAGDLPFVTSTMVARLAVEAPAAAAVAPRVGGIWQPLFARYSPSACRPLAEQMLAEGRLAPFRLLGALGERAVALSLDETEVARLADWDTPEDAQQGAPPPGEG